MRANIMAIKEMIFINELIGFIQDSGRHSLPVGANGRQKLPGRPLLRLNQLLSARPHIYDDASRSDDAQ
jgi:hypothetical protein